MRISMALALALLPVPVMAETPRVVTDIPPVHALVAQVMGDLGQPDLLLDRGANAHGFALRPSQAAGLQRAGLVVWIGPEMTPWLDRALAGLGGNARQLGLLAAEGTFTRAFDDDGHGHDHDDHDGEDDSHDHDDRQDDDHAGHDHDHDHGHSHQGTDPHAWLDPANALHWLDLIAAELSALDAANAATYAANAARAKQDIAALDARLTTDLAPLRGRRFVVTHDAYGYFSDHYGLENAGSLAHGDAAAPGAARLQALRATLAADRVVCAFPETGNDPKLMQTVIEGTAVRLGAPLDPEGREVAPGPEAYAAILTGLAGALRACLAD